MFADRRGRVVDLVVGDAHTVAMMDHDIRRGTRRLAGVRCIHTHPGDSPYLSDVDLSALRQLHLDCMAVIAAADPHCGSAAYLSPGSDHAIESIGPLSYEKLCAFPWQEMVRRYEKRISSVDTTATGAEQERAFLIGLEDSVAGEERPLEELAQLAEAAGAVVVGQMTQRLERPDRATYLGSGKIRELTLALQVTRADLLIVDEELLPAQQRRLENLTGIRVVDRTALILDIFAGRARTREGKLQVELAQLHYLLPRLTGQGQALSRLGGGIGTRGPGETKLETDRRHLRRRMRDLEGELNHVRHHRERLRHSRQRLDLPLISMVGYTNAGKSTLSNLLVSRFAPFGGTSPAGEDKLFATLDPTTRRIRLLAERDVLLSDTVGFIRKLPHSLVRAFRATLEEIVAADLLLHIVDASHPAAVEQMRTVEAVLAEIGAGEKPILTVLNKIDRLQPGGIDALLRPPDPWVALSAYTGEGVDGLLEKIARLLPDDRVTIDVLIPYDEGKQIHHLYQIGVVRELTHEVEGVRVRADVPKAYVASLPGRQMTVPEKY
ncbi:GTP-binding domain protein [Heliomicrobium modesticaldum Ice1]|uniref:GTPase HflX n=1 Tax=Heliobacterium modesticaldum (strain ATCC 51547 / Ice1) TaxID=498761 RepID=B0TAZ9_HELMI|nr:GTPase HflX [Heliomicrobium modesticaldum]ABZ85110.1 GTP-binding domain protein [Heliomicrobium modesticaldum Ice1]